MRELSLKLRSVSVRWNLVRLGYFAVLAAAVLTAARLYGLAGIGDAPTLENLRASGELREARQYIETLLASAALLTAGCGLFADCLRKEREG